MQSIFTWFMSLFCNIDKGYIFKKLAIAAAKPIVKDIFNTKYQKKAYEFVKELSHRNDLTSLQKAKMFNEKFRRFIGVSSKQVSDSVINCLREMAYVAFKSTQK